MVAPWLDLAQILMDELHCHRSFAHSRCNALDRPVAHVTHGENPGYVRLQQKRVALQRPASGPCSVPKKIRPGQDEPAIVALHHVGQPVGARQSADKDKHGTRSIFSVSEHSTEISSTCLSPCTSATLACVQSSMFGVRWIWSIRYCDIVLERDSPRTRMTTRLA